jgi:hypothetical protein
MSNPITPLTTAQTAVQENEAAHDNPIIDVLIDTDVFASEITGGQPNITISTRLADDAVDGHGVSKEVGKIGSDILDVFQPDHGAKAAAGDLERADEAAKDIEDSGMVNQ